MDTKLERSRTRVAGFADAEMDYQLMRQLGAVRYGGASVGECLALAQRIKNADPASWVNEFTAAGQRQQTDAAARLARQHLLSAADQYLVASNNYRAAEYYCAVNDPRHARLGLQSRECFLAALRARGVACEAFSLPLDDLALPAYYFPSPNAGSGKNKTLMIISGYDGTLEETWLAYGYAALERGYHLMLFTGPGQMDTLRFYPMVHFIPEFERIGRVALDHVLARPQTDPDRLALMGISFGGYFSTRIAAHDDRVRALIPNSPIIDLHRYMASFVGFDPAELPDSEDVRLQDIDHLPDAAVPPQTRTMMRNLMLRLGRTSFKAAYQRLREFHVADEALVRIRCPSLALVGEGEGKDPLAQSEHFCQHVGGPVRQHVFTADEGADAHCQNTNLAYSAAVSMDWLDETFA
ncbi:S9 family peptidase [Comamonas sp. NLF-1-9]|uniref:alpha/beta hydrolase family protein n=1 Tax=Comamonas sp. NLF-1-9 TaxID=2853163 RepID=UPI001C43E09D|nr:prolyl oligopeptidase family serine peptidase [Comamonas sp. NLF-1-9]QXL83169.1 prolyl oligopeptidase family serine peptidase [Comamonas sp. NLF-1-9]